MYAEITIETKSDLPSNLSYELNKVFSGVGIQQALESTIWKKDTDIVNMVIFAHSSNPKTILVYKPENLQRFKIHIENFIKGRDLLKLKKSVKETIGLYEDFIKRQKIRRHIMSPFGRNSIKKLDITINAEEDDIMTGEMLSWWSRFKISLKGEFFAKALIPIVTFFVLKFFFAEAVEQALFKALVATACAILWVFFSATFVIKPLSYSEK